MLFYGGLNDGQMIVGDGTTDPVAESGASLEHLLELVLEILLSFTELM